MENLRKLWKETIKPKISLIFISFILGIGVMGGIWIYVSKSTPAPEPEVRTIVNTVEKEVERKVNVTTDYVKDQLTDIGELATIQADYMGILRVEDEDGITFINKTGYSMLYTIEARCGIQMDDIKIDVSDTEVTVTLPEPKVLSRHADGSTLEFYDEKWALFKKNELNDVPMAVKMAEEDFDSKTDKINQYLDLAKQRAILSVHNLLEGIIGDKKLVVK